RTNMNKNTKELNVQGLTLADAGIYICECGSQAASVSLRVLSLVISSNGQFLANEDLELTLTQNSSHPQPHLTIRLFNSNNNIVTPEVLREDAPEKYVLKLKQLSAADSGTWRCHVHADSPPIDQDIPFDLKVLGFRKSPLERMYATVGSTVILSWHLNFKEIEWKKGFTGQLNWKTQGSATTHELLDFNASAHRELHKTKKSNLFWFEVPENKHGSTVEVKLPKVQFHQSGQYQCQLAFDRHVMRNVTELVLMQVSANPAGPLRRGAEVTLLCQVSSRLPSNARLRWEGVNGNQMDIRSSKLHEAKVEVNVSAAGLWNCHLVEDNVRKISLNYTVEEAPVWLSYAVIGAIIGASVLVIGLVCLCIIIGMSWQRRRQRARRMARARQYLLEKKTCQCQQ
ncbi:CD4 protein, partial [Alectura lathami]|nr:CD4 protein [Alectura lathami]